MADAPISQEALQQLAEFIEAMHSDRKASQGVVRLGEGEMEVLLLLLHGDRTGNANGPSRLVNIERDIRDIKVVLNGKPDEPEKGLVAKVSDHVKVIRLVQWALALLATGVVTLLARWFSTLLSR